MRALGDMVKYLLLQGVCRIRGHRWLWLPTDGVSGWLEDRICMRCLVREIDRAEHIGRLADKFERDEVERGDDV